MVQVLSLLDIPHNHIKMPIKTTKIDSPFFDVFSRTLNQGTNPAPPLSGFVNASPILNTSDAGGQFISSGTRQDAYANYIVLAIPFNGANNGSSFTDYSSTIRGSGSAKTITANNAVTKTDVYKFYGSSGYLSSSAARVSTSADFQLSSDFTLEFWTYKTSYERFMCPFMISPDSNSILSINMGNNINGWNFQCSQNGASLSNTFNASTWTHLAMTRSGSTVFCFINGTLQSTFTESNSVGSSSDQILIGDYRGDQQYSYGGYIQDLRIYKGIAKYVSSFTPF